VVQVPLPAPDKALVLPAHKPNVPAIADGSGSTRTIVVAIQPTPEVKVIIVVPAATPLTTPVVEPMVALGILLLTHIPVIPSIRVVVEPTHTSPVPVIDNGSGFTVTIVVV